MSGATAIPDGLDAEVAGHPTDWRHHEAGRYRDWLTLLLSIANLGAYKNIDAVMENQSDLTDIVHTLKQVVCVKG